MKPNSHLNALDQIYSFQEFEVDNADYLEFEKKVYFFDNLNVKDRSNYEEIRTV